MELTGGMALIIEYLFDLNFVSKIIKFIGSKMVFLWKFVRKRSCTYLIGMELILDILFDFKEYYIIIL